MNIKSLKEKIGHLYNKVSCRKESAVGHRHLFYVAEVGITVYPVVDVIH